LKCEKKQNFREKVAFGNISLHMENEKMRQWNTPLPSSGQNVGGLTAWRAVAARAKGQLGRPACPPGYVQSFMRPVDGRLRHLDARTVTLAL